MDSGSIPPLAVVFSLLALLFNCLGLATILTAISSTSNRLFSRAAFLWRCTAGFSALTVIAELIHLRLSSPGMNLFIIVCATATFFFSLKNAKTNDRRSLENAPRQDP